MCRGAKLSAIRRSSGTTPRWLPTMAEQTRPSWRVASGNTGLLTHRQLLTTRLVRVMIQRNRAGDETVFGNDVSGIDADVFDRAVCKRFHEI